MARPRADADSPWKEALGRYLRECLALFLPEAHAEIDWSRPPEFLDTELRQAVRGGRKRARWTGWCGPGCWTAPAPGC